MFLYYRDPSVVNKSYVPINNNLYNLGSETLGFASVFVKTGIYYANDKGANFRNAANSAYVGSIKVNVSDNMLYNIENSKKHIFQVNGGTNLTIDNGGCVAGFTGFTFGQDTSAASDNRYTAFSGANDSFSRAGLIRLYGINHGSLPGNAEIYAGAVSGASIILALKGTGGRIDFNSSSANLWGINQADGDIEGDASNGGNLVFNRPGKTVVHNLPSPITATGTTAIGAFALTGIVNQVDTVTASNNGVRLPTAVASMDVWVWNNDSADNLNVYPPTGGVINRLAVDAAIVLTPGQAAVFKSTSSTGYFCVKTA